MAAHQQKWLHSKVGTPHALSSFLKFCTNVTESHTNPVEKITGTQDHSCVYCCVPVDMGKSNGSDDLDSNLYSPNKGKPDITKMLFCVCIFDNRFCISKCANTHKYPQKLIVSLVSDLLPSSIIPSENRDQYYLTHTYRPINTSRMVRFSLTHTRSQMWYEAATTLLQPHLPNSGEDDNIVLYCKQDKNKKMILLKN
ncbi:unnamed protein product [Menidia menidia]|uniref:(Atlantic silverside) hypothetical protein n=1 Tax=Menidia menidia TaxID=238744 RepID=A0A8S4AS72_9TELE|nr:unnamed protein product [Menidia menidia]